MPPSARYSRLRDMNDEQHSHGSEDEKAQESEALDHVHGVSLPVDGVRRIRIDPKADLSEIHANIQLRALLRRSFDCGHIEHAATACTGRSAVRLNVRGLPRPTDSRFRSRVDQRSIPTTSRPVSRRRR